MVSITLFGLPAVVAQKKDSVVFTFNVRHYPLRRSLLGLMGTEHKSGMVTLSAEQMGRHRVVLEQMYYLHDIEDNTYDKDWDSRRELCKAEVHLVSYQEVRLVGMYATGDAILERCRSPPQKYARPGMVPGCDEISLDRESSNFAVMAVMKHLTNDERYLSALYKYVCRHTRFLEGDIIRAIDLRLDCFGTYHRDLVMLGTGFVSGIHIDMLAHRLNRQPSYWQWDQGRFGDGLDGWASAV